jgi:hypothetical protein
MRDVKLQSVLKLDSISDKSHACERILGDLDFGIKSIKTEM